MPVSVFTVNKELISPSKAVTSPSTVCKNKQKPDCCATCIFSVGTIEGPHGFLASLQLLPSSLVYHLAVGSSTCLSEEKDKKLGITRYTTRDGEPVAAAYVLQYLSST